MTICLLERLRAQEMPSYRAGCFSHANKGLGDSRESLLFSPHRKAKAADGGIDDGTEGLRCKKQRSVSKQPCFPHLFRPGPLPEDAAHSMEGPPASPR